jgi:segregation and condensation protein A
MSRLPEQTVYEVQGEIFDVEEKMALIASLAAEQGRMTFESLLLRCRVRLEMIVTFVALLELIKVGRVAVEQTENFGDIQIVYRPPEGNESHATHESPVRD